MSSRYPYGPVLEILRGAFHIEEGDNPLQIQEKLRAGVRDADARLEPTLPFLESLFGLSAGRRRDPPPGPQERRRQTLEVLRAVVAGAGQRRPLVLVCENLHWIDHSSEDSFAFLVGSLAGVPVLILTTHRPGLRRALGGRPEYTQIRAGPSRGSGDAEMLTALLGATWPTTSGRFIEDKTGGNPLFIEEVIRALDERQLLERETEDGPAGRLDGDRVSGDHQDIIQARIDRLDDPVKQTTQIAAVIGREFDLRLLAGLAPRPPMSRHTSRLLKRLDLVHGRAFSRSWPIASSTPSSRTSSTVASSDRVARSSMVPSRAASRSPTASRPKSSRPFSPTITRSARSRGERFPSHSWPETAPRSATPSAEAAAYYDQALALARALVVSPEQQRAQIDAALKRVSVSTTREAFAQDQANLEEARTLAATLADEPRMAQILYWLGRLGYVRGAFAGRGRLRRAEPRHRRPPGRRRGWPRCPSISSVAATAS